MYGYEYGYGYVYGYEYGYGYVYGYEYGYEYGYGYVYGYEGLPIRQIIVGIGSGWHPFPLALLASWRLNSPAFSHPADGIESKWTVHPAMAGPIR